MRIVIIGADFAGITVAAAAASNIGGAEVTVIELDRELQRFPSATYSINANAKFGDLEYLKAKRIRIMQGNKIVGINVENRQISMSDGAVSFDFLVLNIPVECRQKFTDEPLDLYEHYENKEIAVVGGGFKGVQIADILSKNNSVTLFEQEEMLCYQYFDQDYCNKIQELLGKKVKIVHEMVAKIENNKILAVSDGKEEEYECSGYINCTGSCTNLKMIKLLKQQLLLEDNYVKINEYCQTSCEYCFCIGGCSIYHQRQNSDEYFNRQAIVVCAALTKNKLVKLQTENMIKSLYISDRNLISVNLPAHAENCQKVKVTDNNRAEFMETYNVISLELNYSQKSRLVLGCQIYSEKDVQWIANSIAMAVQRKMTVEQLLVCDFFFEPYFGKPWNIINLACMATHGLPPFEEYKLRKEGEDEIE